MRISDWSSDVCSSDLQLADAAAGGGHELELQRLALGVVPAAALQLGPAGGVEQRGGLGGGVGVRLHILVVNPVERRGAGMGDGMAAIEEAPVDGTAVDRLDQRLAPPLGPQAPVGQ